MRIYCMKDLFKRVYQVEPAQLQFYTILINVPVFMKVFFGLVIDTKVIKSRASILVIFGINSIITQAVICFVPRLSETVVLILLA